MKRSAKGNILLFMAAIIWGCALVAQKAGMSHLGPFGFTAIRCTLGGLVLLPLIWHLDKKKTDEDILMFLKKRYEIDNPKSISKFSKDDRDKILEELKKEFTVRHIQRITGVSRGVITKV